MLVPDAPACGVQHADRVVVVVGHHNRRPVGGDREATRVGLDVDAEALSGVSERNLPGESPPATAGCVDVDRVVLASGHVQRAIRAEGHPDVRVGLLQDLEERGRALVVAAHVVEEDELGRAGDVDLSSGVVERVLPGAEDRQRLAVRAQGGLHRLSGDEARIGGQPGVQEHLDGAWDRGGADELAGGDPLRLRFACHLTAGSPGRVSGTVSAAHGHEGREARPDRDGGCPSTHRFPPLRERAPSLGRCHGAQSAGFSQAQR